MSDKKQSRKRKTPASRRGRGRGKKRYKRSFNNYGLRPSITKAVLPTPFPDKMITNLKYGQLSNRTPAALLDLFEFNANSIYDPDRTTTGHQPMYHDQLMGTIYNRYRVTGLSFRLTFAGADVPIRILIVPYNNNSAPVDFNDAIENHHSQSGIINAMTSGGHTQHTFKGSFRIKNILGEKISDDRDQAAAGASPTNIVILGCRVESLDGATNIGEYNLDVRLIYHVELFDRIPVAGS